MDEPSKKIYKINIDEEGKQKLEVINQRIKSKCPFTKLEYNWVGIYKSGNDFFQITLAFNIDSVSNILINYENNYLTINIRSDDNYDGFGYMKFLIAVVIYISKHFIVVDASENPVRVNGIKAFILNIISAKLLVCYYDVVVKTIVSDVPILLEKRDLVSSPDGSHLQRKMFSKSLPGIGPQIIRLSDGLSELKHKNVYVESTSNNIEIAMQIIDDYCTNFVNNEPINANSKLCPDRVNKDNKENPDGLDLRKKKSAEEKDLIDSGAKIIYCTIKPQKSQAASQPISQPAPQSASQAALNTVLRPPPTRPYTSYKHLISAKEKDSSSFPVIRFSPAAATSVSATSVLAKSVPAKFVPAKSVPATSVSAKSVQLPQLSKKYVSDRNTEAIQKYYDRMKTQNPNPGGYYNEWFHHCY